MEWKLTQKSISFSNRGFECQDNLIAILLTLRELGEFWSVGEMTEEGKLKKAKYAFPTWILNCSEVRKSVISLSINFRSHFLCLQAQWTLLGYWQCSDVEKLEITSRVKWIKKVLMYVNLWHLCINMRSRKWCAKFNPYWRGESENGMVPGGTKAKGPPLWCQGKVFSVC